MDETTYPVGGRVTVLRGILLALSVVAIAVWILYFANVVGALAPAIANGLILVVILVRYWETEKVKRDAGHHDG
jgi:hypothetical protein